MSALDAARTLFTELSGRDPEGVWSAPGRVNLIGEHTDYNEGFVLPFAIPHRTFAAARLRDDDRVRVTSTFAADPVEVGLDDLEVLFPALRQAQGPNGQAQGPNGQTHGPDGQARPAVPEWSAYVLGVAWALQLAAPEAPLRGVDIAIASDVPVGAGLSSSAAIEGSVASALNDLWKLDLDPVALAQVGRRAENEAVGAPTGIMDQMASMLGRPDAATFIDCRSLATESVPTGFTGEGLEVLVIDT